MCHEVAVKRGRQGRDVVENVLGNWSAPKFRKIKNEGDFYLFRVSPALTPILGCPNSALRLLFPSFSTFPSQHYYIKGEGFFIRNILTSSSAAPQVTIRLHFQPTIKFNTLVEATILNPKSSLRLSSN
ncbi:hypothetical protein EYR41_006104 [Orbilia oligospora]|uniref:Uncharacterized protein n=1 Tax=Orbilia oligospora TaxID=2813651 RepID=A0A8H2E658_ORBOL|nr:hypothetical protein EYR41_006104 [Orbilia oligospora]